MSNFPINPSHVSSSLDNLSVAPHSDALLDPSSSPPLISDSSSKSLPHSSEASNDSTVQPPSLTPRPTTSVTTGSNMTSLAPSLSSQPSSPKLTFYMRHTDLDSASDCPNHHIGSLITLTANTHASLSEWFTDNFLQRACFPCLRHDLDLLVGNFPGISGKLPVSAEIL